MSRISFLLRFSLKQHLHSSQLPRDRGDEPADPRGGQQAVHRLRGAHADEPAGVQDQGVPVSPQVQRLRLAQDGNQEGSPGESSYTEMGKKAWLFVKLQPGRARGRISAT